MPCALTVLDNDADGFVDCEDWDCSYNPDVTICESPICG